MPIKSLTTLQDYTILKQRIKGLYTRKSLTTLQDYTILKHGA